jgi:hypothetical protein
MAEEPIQTPTNSMAPALAPGGAVPGNVKANQLDAPLRTRVLSTGPVQTKTSDPFSGLGFVDLLQVRAAMEARLSALSSDPQTNQAHIDSTKRVLAMAQQRLAPRAAQEGLTFLTPTVIPPSAAGIRQIPPMVPPAAS